MPDIPGVKVLDSSVVHTTDSSSSPGPSGQGVGSRGDTSKVTVKPSFYKNSLVVPIKGDRIAIDSDGYFITYTIINNLQVRLYTGVVLTYD